MTYLQDDIVAVITFTLYEVDKILKAPICSNIQNKLFEVDFLRLFAGFMIVLHVNAGKIFLKFWYWVVKSIWYFCHFFANSPSGWSMRKTLIVCSASAYFCAVFFRINPSIYSRISVNMLFSRGGVLEDVLGFEDTF